MCAGRELSMTRTVSTEEFESSCLEMIDLIEEKGFTYVITKDGQPIARMEPVKAETQRLSGKID